VEKLATQALGMRVPPSSRIQVVPPAGREGKP
jgi:cell division protein FtsL